MEIYNVSVQEIVENIDNIDFREYQIDFESFKTILTVLYYTGLKPKDKFYNMLEAIEGSEITQEQKLYLKHIIASILLYSSGY